MLAAEAAGFNDAWIAEHHFMTDGHCPSAITFAAPALGRTSRIGVDTAVSVLSTTHPVALAEQVALLDHLAEGRLWLRVGRGGPWVDLEVFGIRHVIMMVAATGSHARTMATIARIGTEVLPRLRG